MLVWRLEYNTTYFDGDENILVDKLIKENKTGIIHQNRKGPHRTNCVINSGGTDNGLYIIWVDEEDMVTPIDFPREWDSGTTRNSSCVSRGI